MNKEFIRSRRRWLKLIGASGAYFALGGNLLVEKKMIKRTIPSSGRKIGVVGLGTWQTFDVGNSSAARNPLKEVLKTMVESGGEVVDSSPMYGSSERVVGDLASELNLNDRLFKATKVWTNGKDSGMRQMRSSMSKMKTDSIDLMQIHNLMDWKTHIKTLYDWKENGLVKHIGITHYVDSAHGRLEDIIKNEDIDFVQVNYSMMSRNAERSLLPTAKDRGVAVLINRPYEGGSLFRKVKELPQWASELDISSWGQYFLKYILGSEAVTCVIPGTSKPHHMKDNVQAGMGRMPTQEERKKMLDYLKSL